VKIVSLDILCNDDAKTTRSSNNATNNGNDVVSATRRHDGDDPTANSNNKHHLQQARMEDNIETQETAIGRDGGNCDNGIQSTSSPTQMKDQGTLLLPSPLRHQIARVGARANNPYFDQVHEDTETALQYNLYTCIPI
jgi:hypothetical protein